MATIDELGLTPYQRIMAQMTPTMNPYTGANVAIGGYDPALYSRRGGSGLINYGGGGMVGGDSGGGGSGGFSNPFSDLTQAQQAAYYAANPTMAGITQLGQKGFGLTSLGMLQNYFNPGFVSEQGLIAMGVNPAAYQGARESFRASEIDAMNAGYPSAQQNNIDAGFAVAADAEAAAAQANAAANAAAGIAAAQDAQDAAQASQDAANNAGASAAESAGPSGEGTDSGGDGYAQGGKVTKNRLKSPDPKGPDEGYGALLSGEYVIKKSAVKKYGQGLLDMINDGKIPAKKMKSLLG